MRPQSDALRARLSHRIRFKAPPEWGQFANAWMAFNSLYGGEPDADERRRVMALVRRLISKAQARRILSQIAPVVDRLLKVPPGDMRREHWDPAFRRVSQRLARQYHLSSADAVSRLAAVAGILYQVRCNLIHGSKDPTVQRDRDLVRHSLSVLMVMLPELESSADAA